MPSKLTNNILLTKCVINDEIPSFVEDIPRDFVKDDHQLLYRKPDGNYYWLSIDPSLNIIFNKNIYSDKNRIGIGRPPLHNYAVDIAIPSNKVITALHIGDGSVGFSFGNGTSQGFIPEIIGIGGDEDDAGLYFVGMANNSKSSDTPLIIFDGRNAFNKPLENRPILGISSGSYNEFGILIDSSFNMHIKSNIFVNDIFLDGISINSTLSQLKTEIDRLKNIISL